MKNIAGLKKGRGEEIKITAFVRMSLNQWDMPTVSTPAKATESEFIFILPLLKST